MRKLTRLNNKVLISIHFSCTQEAANILSKCLTAASFVGQCGSCWAFAAAKAYSMSLYQATQGRVNIRLSQQHLVSCMKDTFGYREQQRGFNSEGLQSITVNLPQKIAAGCNGGNAFEAWTRMMRENYYTERCDPYTGRDHYSGDKCGSFDAQCRGSGAETGYQVEKFYLVIHPTLSLPQ